MTHHIDLGTIHLINGAGKGDELCVMQWTARFAGEEPESPDRWSDHPSCTSPVLTAFAIAWNDALPDETRQRLIPFIPRLVGTAGDPAADERRAWMATDWLVRVFTPTWLRKAGLVERADELAALPEFSGPELAAAAQPIIEQAEREAAAVRDAAWDAARAAARDAAWAAAKGKKGYQARYDAAYAAARPLVDAALGETTAELTEAAFELFDRMIDVKSAVPA